MIDRHVLITGGAGYIGSICVEQLCESGHNVTVIDDISQGHPAAVDRRARFIQARVGDDAKVSQLLKESEAEAIIHFAASALVPESMANPGKYFRNNVSDTINLLNATVGAGITSVAVQSYGASTSGGTVDAIRLSNDPDAQSAVTGFAPVPEPTTLGLVGIAASSLLARRRRRRR